MAWRGVSLVIFPLVSSALGKGLFSGVPCARSYRCISESSNMMAEIPSIFLEHECQAACAAFSSCVSYTWASERAGELDMEPYLCQLFTSCHRSYDALQRVSSGKGNKKRKPAPVAPKTDQFSEILQKYIFRSDTISSNLWILEEVTEENSFVNSHSVTLCLWTQK